MNLGLASSSEEGYLVFPLTVSAIYGNEVAFEAGAGGIIANYVEDHYSGTYWLTLTRVTVTRFIPTAIIGFRYQKKAGLFFKLTSTSFLVMDKINYQNSLFDTPETGNLNFYSTLGLVLGVSF